MSTQYNQTTYEQLLDDRRLSRLNVRWSGPLNGDNVSLDFTHSGLDGGILLALTTLGFAATVEAETLPLGGKDHLWIRTKIPNAIHTLSMQMAGTSVKPGGKWRGLGSGPFRLAAFDEKLFRRLPVERESAETWVVVLETARQPDAAIFEFIRALATGDKPKRVIICYAPVNSVAGAVQVAARCPECLFHAWAHHGDWPLNLTVRTWGIAPVAPFVDDEMEMMGRTNEGILEAGVVGVESDDLTQAEMTARAQLLTFEGNFPGNNFRALLAEAGHFSKLPELCFAPSRAELGGRNGKAAFGEPHEERLIAAWGL